MYWEMGNWSLNDNNIILNPMPIFDTIKLGNFDSLILSKDTVSQRLSFKEFNEFEGLGIYQIVNKNLAHTLMYKDDKLFPLNAKGKIIKKYPAKEKRISIRNKSLNKPPIVLFSWKKMNTSCSFERVK